MNKAHLPRAAVTLVTGAAGGGVFYLLHLPLPWMLGALVTTMAVTLAGAPLEIHPTFRQYLIAAIGVMIGGTFSPDLFAQAQQWIPSLISVLFYLFVVVVVSLYYCQWVLKMDRRTAIFSSLPGGLSEMILLGEQLGADVRALTLTHAVRVAAVLIAIPLFLTYGVGLDPPLPTAAPTTWGAGDIALLILFGVIGFNVGKAAHFPAHMLTGPMVVSAAAHLAGLIETEPPAIATIITQATMGSALGARFFGVSVRTVGKLMLGAVSLAFVMMGLTLLFAWGLSALTGLSFAALMLALAPGGFADIALASLSLNVDPAFVASHHGLRLVIVVFLVPWGVSWWLRRTDKKRNTPPS
ncbi:MAG: AbrB family transcriptional regulator [Magnetospiraceae bacterium]